jgi:DNA modification methylase
MTRKTYVSGSANKSLRKTVPGIGGARNRKVDRKKIAGVLSKIAEIEDHDQMKRKLSSLKNEVSEENSPYRIEDTRDESMVNAPYIIGEIEQAISSYTLERSRYYIMRLVRSLTEEKKSNINDINLNLWKSYPDIITDSLWNLDRRESDKGNLAWYWGNYVPQIPRQFILRFSKKGEWIFDPFAGSGTTLFEASRLGRNSVGLDINKDVTARVSMALRPALQGLPVKSILLERDSLTADFHETLAEAGTETAQLIFLHPPYFDIIKFNGDSRDLSNSESLEDFLERMKTIGRKCYDVLDSGRYIVLVIGDKYAEGSWIPVGFYTMQKLMEVGFRLKSIVVKNFDVTRGKRNQNELWRYRALAGGYYVFKHEYIFLMQKK